MTPEDLAAAVRADLAPEAATWLDESLTMVAADATALRGLFPAVGRRCGRGPAAIPGWTTDDVVRVLLLAAAPGVSAALADLYRHGDAAEKRAVLRGLSVVEGVGNAGMALVADALRTNDPRLVTAALGDYAADRLAAPAYRQGVLKCVFMGIPLEAVAGLDRRTDAELLEMMRSFAAERAAAGREIPVDLVALLAEPCRKDA